MKRNQWKIYAEAEEGWEAHREKGKQKKIHLHRIHFTLPGLIYLIYLHSLVLRLYVTFFSSFLFLFPLKMKEESTEKIDCCYR